MIFTGVGGQKEGKAVCSGDVTDWKCKLKRRYLGAKMLDSDPKRFEKM
jgi:hypothetical protein